MAALNIFEQIDSGQLARQIPTVADSKKEERATSALLATFMVVPAFAQEVLSSVEAPTGRNCCRIPPLSQPLLALTSVGLLTVPAWYHRSLGCRFMLGAISDLFLLSVKVK